MLKIILIAIMLIIIVSVPVMAEELGIHGDLSFKYELADYYPGQTWTVDLYYNFTSWLSFGFAEETFTNGLGGSFKIIPSFIPTGQLYEFYGKINLNDNTSIKISQWCLHPVYNSKGVSFDIVPMGLYIEGSYKF